MDVRIAMRSSAVGEDTEATFAGQYDTVLNVTGENILDAYKTVLASKYSARAIAYRLRYGLDDRETPMCVLGIVMVNSQASGVLYSVDPSLTRSCPVKINSLWGIGEHLVDGSASPDVFLIDRIDEKILERHVAVKESRLVNLNAGGTGLESVPEHEQHLPSLDDVTIVQLAKYGLLLEEFFEGPQDVEWAIDADRTIFILQSRPLRLPEINVESQLRQVSSNNPVLISQGKTASGGTATGRVFIMEQEPDLRNLPADAILVAKIASPEYAKVIGSLRGIVDAAWSTGQFAVAPFAADPAAPADRQRRGRHRATAGFGAGQSPDQDLVRRSPPLLRWIDGRAGTRRHGEGIRGYQIPV